MTDVIGNICPHCLLNPCKCPLDETAAKALFEKIAHEHDDPDQKVRDVAIWLVQNDPDPCDPVEYDAAAYYRAFAEALLASGWQIVPPVAPTARNG